MQYDSPKHCSWNCVDVSRSSFSYLQNQRKIYYDYQWSNSLVRIALVVVCDLKIHHFGSTDIICTIPHSSNSIVNHTEKICQQISLSVIENYIIAKRWCGECKGSITKLPLILRVSRNHRKMKFLYFQGKVISWYCHSWSKVHRVMKMYSTCWVANC